MNGRALRFGLALRHEQRVVGTPDVAYDLLVGLRVCLATQLLVQSLLSDEKRNPWNLGKWLRGRDRRDGDWTGWSVQVHVAALNRPRRGIGTQLASLDGE